jgi:hypothetical protein
MKYLFLSLIFVSSSALALKPTLVKPILGHSAHGKIETVPANGSGYGHSIHGKVQNMPISGSGYGHSQHGQVQTMPSVPQPHMQDHEPVYVQPVSHGSR